MQLTAEQLAVIDTNNDLVINAVAGSGKTTTLVEYARTRPADSKILYLAFNKTVKTEAIEKFERAALNNIKVETAQADRFGLGERRGVSLTCLADGSVAYTSS